MFGFWRFYLVFNDFALFLRFLWWLNNFCFLLFVWHVFLIIISVLIYFGLFDLFLWVFRSISFLILKVAFPYVFCKFLLILVWDLFYHVFGQLEFCWLMYVLCLFFSFGLVFVWLFDALFDMFLMLLFKCMFLLCFSYFWAF